MLGARQLVGPATVTAQEIEFPASLDDLAQGTIEPEVPELFFCSDLEGYGWCFRKGDYLNIGLGREDNHRLPDHLAAFCDFLKRRGTIACDPPSRFSGHAYLLYAHAPREVAGAGVLLIGDAAGLAYTQSGEGIRPAVESALMAAEVIVAAGGQYTIERLAPYRGKLMQRFGPRASRGLAEYLPSAMKGALARVLMASPWFTRRVVLDGWFLHVGEGPLPPPQLQAGSMRRIASAA